MPINHAGLHDTNAYQLADAANMRWRRAFKIPFAWLIKRRLLAHFPAGEGRNAVSHSLNNHMGIFVSESSQVKTYLSWIISALNSMNDNDPQKECIREKIVEGVQNCTPGFINRLRDIVLYLKQPKGIAGLLAVMRGSIAEEAFRKDRQDGGVDVHAHESFLLRCNQLGYGVPHIDTHDRYAGRFYEHNDHRITEVFKARYNPTNIVSELWAFTALAANGYAGYKKEGYKGSAPQNILKLVNSTLELSGNDQLGFEDLFIVDEDTYAVYDINWIKLNSMTLELLRKKNIFVQPPGCDVTVFEDSDAKKMLTVEYTHDAIHEAYLTYTDSSTNPPTVLSGFMNEKEKNKNILSILPKKMRDQIVANLVPLLNEADRCQFYLNLLQKDDELTPEMRGLFIVNYRNNAENFGKTLSYLSPAQTEALLPNPSYFSNLFKNAKDFKHAFAPLSAEQKVQIFNKIASIAPYTQWATKPVDIYDLLHYLEDAQKEIVFKELDRDGKLISSLHADYNEEMTKKILLVIKALPVSLVNSYCSKVKEGAGHDFSATEIKQLMHNTADEKRAAVYEAFKLNIIHLLNDELTDPAIAIQSKQESVLSYLSYLTAAQAEELIGEIGIDNAILNLQCLLKFAACPMPVFSAIVEKLRKNNMFASADEFLQLLKALPQAKRAPFMTEYFKRQTVTDGASLAQSSESLMTYFRRCYNAVDRFFSAAPVIFRSNFLRKIAQDATADAQWETILQHAARNPQSRSAKALSMMYMQVTIENQAVEKKVEDFRRVYTALREASKWSLLFSSAKPATEDACQAFEYGTSTGHESPQIRTVETIVRAPAVR